MSDAGGLPSSLRLLLAANVMTMLGKIVGDGPLARTELAEKLWIYIRRNGLQFNGYRSQADSPGVVAM